MGILVSRLVNRLALPAINQFEHGNRMPPSVPAPGVAFGSGVLMSMSHAIPCYNDLSKLATSAWDENFAPSLARISSSALALSLSPDLR